MYTLDTNAVIYYAKGESKTIKVLDGIFREEAPLYISAVSEIELFGFPHLTDVEAKKIERFLQAAIIMPLDSRIARHAGALRRIYKVKTIDSAIAATALLTNSTLITRNIKDFSRISNLRFLPI